jgi:AcrR family transcriptional regulator
MNDISTVEVATPRSVKSEARKRQIIEVIVELLREGGGSALTTDAIAARAHTSKATIYRYWPDMVHLFIEAANQIIQLPAIPDLGSFKDELRQLVTARLRAYQSAGADKMFGALVGLAAEDPIFSHHLRDWMVASQMSTNSAIVRRGLARGEIRADVSVAAVMTIIGAPLVYRLILEPSQPDQVLVDTLVDCVTRGLAPVQTGA